MQQPTPHSPSSPSQASGFQSLQTFEIADGQDLDLGYEGAFPFLTENEVTDSGLRC